MSQETLSNLLAVFVTLAVIGAVLFAIRQIIEIAVWTLKLMKHFEEKRWNQITDKLNKEEARIAEEVEPKFELWWRENAIRALETSPTLLPGMGVPSDDTRVPEELLAMMKGSAIQAISHNAFEFAVHLASSAAHKVYINDLRRVDRGQANEMAKDYEKHLEGHRHELVKVGIDVDEFERQFSA